MGSTLSCRRGKGLKSCSLLRSRVREGGGEEEGSIRGEEDGNEDRHHHHLQELQREHQEANYCSAVSSIPMLEVRIVIQGWFICQSCHCNYRTLSSLGHDY